MWAGSVSWTYSATNGTIYGTSKIWDVATETGLVVTADASGFLPAEFSLTTTSGNTAGTAWKVKYKSVNGLIDHSNYQCDCSAWINSSKIDIPTGQYDMNTSETEPSGTNLTQLSTIVGLARSRGDPWVFFKVNFLGGGSKNIKSKTYYFRV